MRNDLIYIINKYQTILDVCKKYHIKNGLCEVSQTKIAAELKVHQTNINHAFKTINYEQEDIKKIKPGLYKVNTFNINELATFKKVKEIIFVLCNDNYIETKKEKNLASEYNCNIKTIRLAKAILRGQLEESKKTVNQKEKSDLLFFYLIFSFS